ncbi:MAG: methionyl-tRNA formyltransferase [Candidatus Azotimanducaceae bacterium]
MNIVFAGTPEFAARHLAGLIQAGITISTVITQPDKPGKRGKKLIPSPVKSLALDHRLTVLQPLKITAEDLASLKPDLLIVVAYGQILKQDLLDLPTHGCINVHGSLLPRWRGAAPIQRAIQAGDQESGICIMQMDAGLDTGDVLLAAKTTIDLTDTAATVAERLTLLGIEGLITVITQIEQQQLKPEPQPNEGTYAKKIKKQEAKIDWAEPASTIVRKVQAFNPEPVCFSECPHGDSNIRVKVYESEIVATGHQATPGTVINVSAEGVTVAAGTNQVLIKRLQLPLGKGRILDGRDVLNSRTDILYVGAKFQ